MNVNTVILAGHLTRDVELKQVAGGSSVARIGLAINRKYTTAGGEKREEVCFVDCEAWGKSAEIIAQYASKGSVLLVQGRLKLQEWTDKDGGNRSKLMVSVDTFQFGARPQSSEAKPTFAAKPAAGGPTDDIPF